MDSTPRILILYAHPTHQHSRVNQRLCEAAKTVPSVHLHDLYEAYPDFHIDVEHEQSLLVDSDLIVFQHPIQWFSMPSLLKEWVDVVLAYGWAYGHDGNALQGKDFWLVATTGGDSRPYQESGYHHHEFGCFLPPFEQTALACGMRWLPPFILHGARQVDDAAIARYVDYYREHLASYPVWVANALATAHEHTSTDS